MSIGSVNAYERFSVFFPDGRVLFDEDDVEQYVDKTNTFILSIAASKRLVTNWRAFVDEAERTSLTGELPEADGHAFEAKLGRKTLATGTIAGSPTTLYFAPSGAVLLYGDMPLMINRHVHLGIGRFCGDLKIMVEGGSERAFSTVLTKEVASHFHKQWKLAD